MGSSRSKLGAALAGGRDALVRASPCVSLTGESGRSDSFYYMTYNRVSRAKERAGLDSFAHLLSLDPKALGCITAYAGVKTCLAEATARAMRAKRYLVRHGDIAANRVITNFPGYREEQMLSLQILLNSEAKPRLEETIPPAKLHLSKRCNEAPSYNRKR